jgi:hypothetical protein
MEPLEPNLAAIPHRLLHDLYLVRAAKETLALGVCPDCRHPFDVIDTWERAWPHAVCGYAFNLYHWPKVFAAFDPERGIQPDPHDDPWTDLLQHAAKRTLAEDTEVVQAWKRGTPKAWGFLAGKAVGTARRLAERSLTDAERREVWAAL